MKQKLSLIVLGGSGSKIRQIHLSARQTAALAVVLFLVAAALVYGAFDYAAMRSDILDKEMVEQQLAHQSEQVIQQRLQIQRFAEEINTLKERIVVLDEFEQQIRLLANIKEGESGDGLFGVGGSAPEDLNPKAQLQEAQRGLVKDMHRQVKQLANASEMKENSLGQLIDRLEARKNLMAHTPTIRPAQGHITSKFDYRQSPFTGKREFHKGIDIANRHGTPIVAPADGVVSFAGENGALGLVLVIDHGYGVVTRYAHLQKSLKKRGERVRRGDTIALMGNSGRSTGPHLHYEVRLNGVPVNPAKYMLN